MTLYSQGASRETGNRSDRIRTCDPLFPKQMRYQAALHSEVVVPIAASPELPRRLPQLRRWWVVFPSQLRYYNTTYDPCQTEPSAPSGICGPPTSQGWGQR